MEDFFISYSSKDIAWALLIKDVLSDLNFTVIMQKDDFRFNDNFIHKMDEALKNSKRAILVISNNYLNSDFCKSEWTALMAKDPIGKNGLLVPIRIEQVDDLGLLQPRGYIDIFDKDRSEIFEIFKIKLENHNMFDKKKELTVIDGKNITINYIKEAGYLDQLVYDKRYILSSVKIAMGWFACNNEIYTMLYSNLSNSVIAYTNIIPITDHYYDLIKTGTFIDVNLPSDAVVSYDIPGAYNLYFCSVVIHPDYQNTGVLKYLIDTIIKKIIRLGANEIYMKRMLADAVTDKGKKFCSLFGMEKVYESDHNSTIYEVDLLPPRFNTTAKVYSKLYNYYKEISRNLIETS